MYCGHASITAYVLIVLIKSALTKDNAPYVESRLKVIQYKSIVKSSMTKGQLKEFILKMRKEMYIALRILMLLKIIH